jgi:alpha-beta hydrolase superfamily lysophospholipase
MAFLLEGCATPYVQPISTVPSIPSLNEAFAVMDDGYRLPLTYWNACEKDQAVILALHGLNDYSTSFETTGEYLARRGITVVAYDQRGFGNSNGRGLWHGSDRMTRDLHAMIALLHYKYPDKPLYLLGESMGGAVILAAMDVQQLAANGIILLAPAVWSRDTMPFYQRFILWLTAHTLPALKLTGEGLDLRPSDNDEMLRALSLDPIVIKETRVDVLYGVSNLMDQAVNSSHKFNGKSLILYGKRDEIIPRKPTCQWLHSLPSESGHFRQTLIYDNGYHMLTRDLQANAVLEDIATWINATGNRLADRHDITSIHAFCPEDVPTEPDGLSPYLD